MIVEWDSLYSEIAAEFGYSRDADQAAASRLNELLSGRNVVGADALRRRLGGKTVVVAGPVASTALPDLAQDHVVIAADAATTTCLSQAIFPGVIATDLDGDLRDQVWANDRGAIAVVHAHGDNRSALETWVPQFAGPVCGSTQVAPVGVVHNFGGFTDGDRACFLAAASGAREIIVTGFDFDNPIPKFGKDLLVKRRKLAWARQLIARVSEDVPVKFA